MERYIEGEGGKRIREIGSYPEVAGRSSKINQEMLGEETRQYSKQDLELRKKIREIISDEFKGIMINIRNIWRKNGRAA